MIAAGHLPPMVVAAVDGAFLVVLMAVLGAPLLRAEQ
jgi:hypothetical protein